MRIAWTRSRPAASSDPSDDLATILQALGRAHRVDTIGVRDAHDMVRRQRLQPYDLCVYELSNRVGDEFIWPYLFHYPGVLVLRGETLHDARARTLEAQHRFADYTTEFRFNHRHAPATFEARLPRGRWPMLRTALTAARLVIVPDQEIALRLQHAYGYEHIRHIGIGVSSEEHSRPPRPSDNPVRFGLFGERQRGIAERALARARTVGAAATLVDNRSPRDILNECDVVLALVAPWTGESLAPAVAGMALNKPVVVFEIEATAIWPALNPQTWQPRDAIGGRTPVVISIDPRDKEHSLMLVMRRLAAEPPLRERLAAAGHEWWRTHATVEHVLPAWQAALDTALTVAPPSRPSDWPIHLSTDGSDAARAIVSEFGVAVDLF